MFLADCVKNIKLVKSESGPLDFGNGEEETGETSINSNDPVDDEDEASSDSSSERNLHLLVRGRIRTYALTSRQ